MAAWPADKVEKRPVAALVPYARNARTHSDGQVAQIAASIREWGWTTPVLVDESDGIIAGHGRVLAAHKLGIGEVPVMVAADWSEAQKRAYILADNKLTLNAGWDNDLLKLEVADLAEMGFDLPLIGFSDDELIALLASPSAGLTDPDEVPETPEQPVSELGDVWVIGKHRLACGSCTEAQVVEQVLDGVSPHLMVTDPPYGVKYDANWRVKAGVGGAGTAIGKVLNDDRADWGDAWKLFPGDVAYIWHAGTFCSVVANSLEACRFKIRAHIVWVKTRHVFGRGDYHFQHEPCLYVIKEGSDEQWNFVPEHEVATYTVRLGERGHYEGGRKQSTVWNIEHIKSETGHSTQKPVECMKRPIENNSSPGQAVYDPFSGSGTTIIAGEMTGRCVYAIELNPAYVDVAVTRRQNFTGQQATLNGKTFNEMAAERHKNAA